jgi:UDP-N-acetylglucosamine 2-epimerase (non-hydrolysing)
VPVCNQKKVLLIAGTRPETIKLAPVLHAIREEKELIAKFCVTAQHREMLDQALNAFDIVPDYDLNLMVSRQSLSQLAAKAIQALDALYETEAPDLVLVQGDTTTTFCAALSAFHRRIPIGHVEAGLRTWDLDAPWPEEANRTLVSRLAVLHFAPTNRSRDNLLREQVPPDRIFVTGNTVVDAIQMALGQLGRTSFPDRDGVLAALERYPDGMILITGHRRESFGKGFEEICTAIRQLAVRFPRALFVYPVHLNPNVRGPVYRILGAEPRENIRLIEPLSYLDFVACLSRARLVLTDSGGVQEEAPGLGKPVLVMRERTERPEGVEAGVAKLVGTRAETIVFEATRFLTDPEVCHAMSCAENPYGDGHASERIGKICARYLRDKSTPAGENQPSAVEPNA